MLIEELISSNLVRRLHSIRSDEPYYVDIRLKLFIKRFICHIESLKRKNRLRAGKFGSNLAFGKDLKLHCPDDLVHPLEYMLVDYNISKASISDFIAFIIGLNGMQSPIRAGFCFAHNIETFVGTRYTMFTICNYLLNYYFSNSLPNYNTGVANPPTKFLALIKEQISYHQSKCRIGTTTEGESHVFTRTS